LPDGGAAHFASVVQVVRKRRPESTIEILTPDFQGDRTAIDTALESGCDVFNHNIETVARLHEAVRPQADYRRSLSVLARAGHHSRNVRIKSGLMVGLGETRQEIRQVMRDLRDVGCEILTIGQYLSPSQDHHPVDRFVEPDEFVEMELEARDMGFSAVAAGALVRSSYRSGELFQTGMLNCGAEGERLHRES
jgi:lipoic acid synthetase